MTEKRGEKPGGNAREPDRRFPRSVYGVGSEPDPRFSLANERTFLSWIRTALALIAGGIALEAVALPIQPGFRLAAAAVLIVAGILAALQAWFGWSKIERAMRMSLPLPSSPLNAPLVVLVIVVAVLVALGFLLR